MMNEDSTPTKKKSTEGILFSRGNNNNNNYKIWVIAAILLLSIWSIFTGTVTLKWSSSSFSSSINHFSDDDFDSPFINDLDVLEIEDREKVVKHMWEVYTQSRRIHLPKFWQEAFEAAYQYLVSDDPFIRGSAISEIAKMSSIRSLNFDPPPPPSIPSTSKNNGGRKGKINSLKEAKSDDDGHGNNKKNKVESK